MTFVGSLLFFGSSALTALALALVIFKFAGLDPFNLGGPFSPSQPTTMPTAMSQDLEG